MKYSTFTKLIEGEGLKVSVYDYSLIVYDPATGNTMISIGKESVFTFSTNYRGFEKLSDHDKRKLSDWAIKLASTPLDEREDEKRYRLRLPFIESYSHLNLDKIKGVYGISNEKQFYNYQTIFTESEIEELKAKYNLDSFVMEEVSEDE